MISARSANRCNPDMLYDLIKSHAVLFFTQRRQKTTEGGALCMCADEADFAAANDVFTLLNDTAFCQLLFFTGGDKGARVRHGTASRRGVFAADIRACRDRMLSVGAHW